MDRADVDRWFAGFRAAEERRRELEAAEGLDTGRSIARSLSLIAAMRATIPAAELERQRAADDASVREVWARLRAAYLP